MVGVFSKGKSCRALGQWLKYPRDLKLKGFFFFNSILWGYWAYVKIGSVVGELLLNR